MKLLTIASLLLAAISFPLHSRSEEKVKSVASYFPANLEDADGNPIDASVLEGKIVGVFLSAHYCAGCKVFCPALVKFREKHKDDGFEVVFISRDENEKEKAIYVAEAGMEWPIVPGVRSKDARKFASKFASRALPELIVFAPDGSVITKEGVNDVWLTPEFALENWRSAIES